MATGVGTGGGGAGAATGAGTATGAGSAGAGAGVAAGSGRGTGGGAPSGSVGGPYIISLGGSSADAAGLPVSVSGIGSVRTGSLLCCASAVPTASSAINANATRAAARSAPRSGTRLQCAGHFCAGESGNERTAGVVAFRIAHLILLGPCKRMKSRQQA
jgi:hypothetical protein